ncbi:hypothetical protein NA57DRAFT_75579 [Rhizodiscina lignyota]|uniref:Zn(2)-C6 fungal-type domain-containing protein n=1 Tax=Rhizodiscina lignyota TaxID=1504668 RepID=A0A9P4M7K1_9PEZI|nr:hypothetical protein NA57DRAFT_75579 [Rhizodiscina lignyota]
MSTPQRSASEADSNIRKRVCKACDRCRLKKSKCDGASPCSRCRADNAICVFGERKKSHDKVYPKGYVEMLEQQQSQLVAGLRELYRRLNAGESWPGAALPDASNGQPLTHDILERLDLLHMQTENHGMTDGFEEDTEAMQRRLIESGASLVRRRGSISSNSDHSHDHDHHSPLSYDTPSSARSSQFSEAFPGHRAPPTPPMSNSPFSRPSQLHTVKPVGTTFPPMMQSGMEAPSFMRPSWSSQSPAIVNDDGMDFMTYESPMSYDPMMYPAFGSTQAPLANQVPITDWNDPIDMDFSNFIATTT